MRTRFTLMSDGINNFYPNFALRSGDLLMVACSGAPCQYLLTQSKKTLQQNFGFDH